MTAWERYRDVRKLARKLRKQADRLDRAATGWLLKAQKECAHDETYVEKQLNLFKVCLACGVVLNG